MEIIMINVTKEEFVASQNALSDVLAEKYDITNQSKGLLEYLAARVLGYQNHHQLNAKLTQKPSFSYSNDKVVPMTNINQAILGMLYHDDITETIDDTRCAENLTNDEIDKLLIKVFGVDEPGMIPSAIKTRSYLLLKDCVGFNINYYNNRSDFENRTNADFEGGYTFLVQVMEDLYAQYESDDMNFYAISIIDNDFDESFTLTKAQLGVFFSQYRDMKILLEDVINILLFKKKLCNISFFPAAEIKLIGREGKIESIYCPSNNFHICIERVSGRILTLLETVDLQRLEIYVCDESISEEDSALIIDINKVVDYIRNTKSAPEKRLSDKNLLKLASKSN